MLDTNLPDTMLSLTTELQRQVATKRDLMADTRLVSFTQSDANWLRSPRDEEMPEKMSSDLSLLVDMPEGVEAFRVTRHAHQQIADRLKVGWKLYERLLGAHPDLLMGLGNGLLSREPETRMLRTLDGKVRAFLSNAYRPRDNWDLIEQAVLPALLAHPARLQFERCDLTDTKMYLKIILPDFERQITPRVGDVVRGGVIIQNSEVGDGTLGVFPYTNVLVCTNGMVHTSLGQKSRHVGKRITGSEGEEAWDLYSDQTIALDDAAFFSKCKDTISGVLTETVFDRIVAQMRDLASEHIPGPPDKVVEVFARDKGLTDGEAGSMLTALVEGHDLSQWGFVNALTQTARDLTDADRQTELEKVAGAYVDETHAKLAAA